MVSTAITRSGSDRNPNRAHHSFLEKLCENCAADGTQVHVYFVVTSRKSIPRENVDECFNSSALMCFPTGKAPGSFRFEECEKSVTSPLPSGGGQQKMSYSHGDFPERPRSDFEFYSRTPPGLVRYKSLLFSSRSRHLSVAKRA